MCSAIVRVALGERGNNPDRILHRAKEHINQLTQEGYIPTFEIAINIARDVLRNGYPDDTSRIIINYVLRIHLRSLARKEKLTTIVFQNRRISNKEICSVLYDSARKFSGVRRKLRKVENFLKTKNMQAFIDEITAANGHSMYSESPRTLRRAPAANQRPRTLSYV